MWLVGSNSLRAHRREDETRRLVPAVCPCSMSGGAARRLGLGRPFSGATKRPASATKGDKGDCIGMVTTGGPASYVELLSCVEILRDARNIHNADALEGDDSAISSRRQRARVPMRAR